MDLGTAFVSDDLVAFGAVTASAISGHAGMPARGGMASLTDPEMRSAVLYMFNAGGGSATTAATAAAPPPSGAPAPVASAAGAGGKPDGAKVYASGCNACHAAGVAGAPKFGDKAAWAPRAQQGVAALTASAIKGKGAMPPKGGLANAGEAEIRAAVEYMLAAAKYAWVEADMPTVYMWWAQTTKPINPIAIIA